MREFDIVDLIQRRTALQRDDVRLGIGDDAALLDVPTGQRLVACTDTLVAGVHFPAATAPQDIGWKSLAVNLSDLAAMGAQPAWAMLALTLPQGDAQFIEHFGEGFAELARRFQVALVGGDTTQGPLSATVSAMGLVPENLALTRAGARAGDVVFVTGTLGDAAAALHALREPQLHSSAWFPVMRERLDRPQPPIAAGLALRGLASACIDLSDGLLADLGHVCVQSGVGAEIDADALPISSALRETFTAARQLEFALAGGDDYELCFSVRASDAARVMGAFAGLKCDVTCIGRIIEGAGVRVLDGKGRSLDLPRHGWQHFA